MMTEKSSKKFQEYFCEKCDYTTCRKSQYDRHLTTQKHKMMTNDDIKVPKSSKLYACECGKSYKYRQGLSIHKKTCNLNKITEITIEQPTIEFLLKENLEIKKDNLEMKKMMMDICQKIEPVSNNIVNSNNSNNNVFNINVFLNEQCKDAMNMTEFIESIQLNLQDMMKIADDGQTTGMSNILIDKLNSIDVLKRPVHCSDVKNETIYIKDQDKWEKESTKKPKLKNALDKLTKKSIDAMSCMDDDPDTYVKTISEVLKDPREDKKIISKIAKEMTIK
jgi:hypothetical protein